MFLCLGLTRSIMLSEFLCLESNRKMRFLIKHSFHILPHENESYNFSKYQLQLRSYSVCAKQVG